MMDVNKNKEPNIQNDFPIFLEGQYYFTTHQVAEILGWSTDRVSRQCNKKFKNSIKYKGRHLIPEEDIIDNIDGMKRDSDRYGMNSFERLKSIVETRLFNQVNFYKSKPQWYSKDFVNGLERAYKRALKEIQIFRGEDIFSNRVGGLDE